jgi:hypothetical protein
MKKSSITGYFRHGETPNKRVQDGDKVYLLCKSCEQRFGDWEDIFARRVFFPLHEGGSIEDHNDPELPSNFNRYVSYSFDIDAACSKTEAFVYVKICRILLIGFIKIFIEYPTACRGDENMPYAEGYVFVLVCQMYLLKN